MFLHLRCLGETSVDFECLLIIADLEVPFGTTATAAVDTSQQLLAAALPAKLPPPPEAADLEAAPGTVG